MKFEIILLVNFIVLQNGDAYRGRGGEEPDSEGYSRRRGLGRLGNRFKTRAMERRRNQWPNSGGSEEDLRRPPRRKRIIDKFRDWRDDRRANSGPGLYGKIFRNRDQQMEDVKYFGSIPSLDDDEMLNSENDDGNGQGGARDKDVDDNIDNNYVSPPTRPHGFDVEGFGQFLGLRTHLGTEKLQGNHFKRIRKRKKNKNRNKMGHFMEGNSGMTLEEDNENLSEE